MNHKISKAIFPIAGLGTRFLPATKSVPKEMITILDRPIIEWAVIEAAKSGIEFINISPLKSDLIDGAKGEWIAVGLLFGIEAIVIIVVIIVLISNR